MTLYIFTVIWLFISGGGNHFRWWIVIGTDCAAQCFCIFPVLSHQSLSRWYSWCTSLYIPSSLPNAHKMVLISDRPIRRSFWIQDHAQTVTTRTAITWRTPFCDDEHQPPDFQQISLSQNRPLEVDQKWDSHLDHRIAVHSDRFQHFLLCLWSHWVAFRSLTSSVISLETEHVLLCSNKHDQWQFLWFHSNSKSLVLFYIISDDTAVVQPISVDLCPMSDVESSGSSIQNAVNPLFAAINGDNLEHRGSNKKFDLFSVSNDTPSTQNMQRQRLTRLSLFCFDCLSTIHDNCCLRTSVHDCVVTEFSKTTTSLDLRWGRKLGKLVQSLTMVHIRSSYLQHISIGNRDLNSYCEIQSYRVHQLYYQLIDEWTRFYLWLQLSLLLLLFFLFYNIKTCQNCADHTQFVLRLLCQSIRVLSAQ